MPVAADDKTALTCRVTASNAVGSAVATTAAVQVSYAAPVANGTLPDLDLVLGAAAGSVAAGAAFTGSALSYAVSGAGATIDASTGAVSVPTGSLLAATTVTVTASNSGGSASVGFKASVKGVLPAAVTAPTLSGTGRIGSSVGVDSGTWSGKPAPTIALQWRRDGVDIAGATGASYVPVAADDKTALTCRVTATNAVGSAVATTAALTVTQVTSTPGFPAVTAAMLAAATSKPNVKYNESDTTNAAFNGGAAVVEAYAAFQGDQSADAAVLAQLRSNLTANNCPGGAGGYGLQHQSLFNCMAALVKRTPRLWNQLTATERTNTDLLVKAVLVAGAAMGSDHNPIKDTKSFIGGEEWRGAAPNWYSAKPTAVLAARMFLGSDDALTTFLNGFSRAAFRTALTKAGLTNAVNVAANTDTWSDANVESALQNWTWKGKTTQGLAMAKDMHEYMFSGTIMTGLGGTAANGWIGAGLDGYGKIRAGEAGLPNKGRLGMCLELDTVDAEGQRSSMSYATWGYRMSMCLALIQMCEGTFDRTSPEVQALAARMQLGHTDFVYKCNQGYNSYAHGASSGSWTAAQMSTTWGWAYNHEIWPTLVKPWLDAA